MMITIFSILFFLVALIFQIFVWRIIKVKKIIFWLFFIFFVFMPVFMAFTITFEIKTFFLYFLIAAAYIQTFPAIQADSPTLKIINLIGNSKEGISKEKITKAFSEYSLREERISDLITEGFLIKDNENFVLTKKGLLLAKLFIAYRKILGIGEGKG